MSQDVASMLSTYGGGASLARVIAAWPTLAEPMQRAVLAVIDSAAK